MSFLRHFKLPQFLKKQQSPAKIKANIKVFDYNALQVKSSSVKVLLFEDLRISCASISDLILTDVWFVACSDDVLIYALQK